MGTIKIGSANNRKGITVNPIEVFFNGNVVKAIMSGLVTIWDSSKPLVPIMTSNTAPSGECSASSTDGTSVPAWKAFDGNSTTVWCSAQSTTAWIQYKFTTPSCIRKVSITNRADRATYALKTFIVQGSNDGSTWTNLTDTITSPDQSSGSVNEFSINNSNYYMYYRINATTLNNKYLEIAELQFYGSQVFGLVPTLSSNVGINGEVISNGGSNPHYVFDGNDSTKWLCPSKTIGQYIGYKFTKPTKVTHLYIDTGTSDWYTSSVQASNDGEIWEDLLTGFNPDDKWRGVVALNNNTAYTYYRWINTEEMNGTKEISTIQFYGDEKDQVKGLVPTMTSNTCEVGEVSASSNGSAYPPYKAFDGDSSTGWGATSASNQWIQYKFVNPTLVRKAFIRTNSIASADVVASNDGSSWTTLASHTFTDADRGNGVTINITSNEYYVYYRITNIKCLSGSTYTAGMHTLQFYGEQLEALVPKMTSNTSPSGVASASGTYTSGSDTYSPYKAFDKNTTNAESCWMSTSVSGSWLQYQFPKAVTVRQVEVTNRYRTDNANVNAPKEFIVQGSNNGSEWTDLGTFTNDKANSAVKHSYNFANDTAYSYYRLYFNSGHGEARIAIGELQFYA